MKKQFLISLLFVIATTCTVNAQIPEKFQGKWHWDIPQGLYGTLTYTADSAIVVYTEYQARFSANWIEYKSDTVRFSYLIQGNKTNVWTVLDSKNNLQGGYVDAYGNSGPVYFRPEDE